MQRKQSDITGIDMNATKKIHDYVDGAETKYLLCSSSLRPEQIKVTVTVISLLKVP